MVVNLVVFCGYIGVSSPSCFLSAFYTTSLRIVVNVKILSLLHVIAVVVEEGRLPVVDPTCCDNASPLSHSLYVALYSTGVISHL